MLRFNEFLMEENEKFSANLEKKDYLSALTRPAVDDNKHKDSVALRHNLLQYLNANEHGWDEVEKHLRAHANHPHLWVRKGVASNAHLNDPRLADVKEKLLQDKSPKVQAAATEPRKKRVLARAGMLGDIPLKAKNKPKEVSEVPVKKEKKSLPKPEKVGKKDKKDKASQVPSKEYEVHKMNPDDTHFSSAEKVFHIHHKGKPIGAVVQSNFGSDYGNVQKIVSYKARKDGGYDKMGEHASAKDAGQHIINIHKNG